MKLNYLALASLALGISLANADRDRTFGDGELPEMLAQFDLNEDGIIDEEERQAAKEARRAARAERRATHIAEFDTDGDGELSDEEREGARDARRAALQANREEKFAEIAGEDGCLDADEFAALPPLEGRNPERVAAIFGRLDSDDDECISLDEFTARLRHHRKPRGRNPQPPRPPRPGGNDEEEERPSPPERPELPERPERPELPEPPERPELPEPPERPELPERPERPELPERPEGGTEE